jgi:ABC-2 type transport system permease protein
VGRSTSVALGVATRGTRRLLKSPASGSPPILIPLFFFAAFTGALAAMAKTTGFDYYSYSAFQFVFVLIQGAMFVGVFGGIDIAKDFESGMSQRLMLAAPRRMSIVAGYLLVSFGRALFVLALLWAAALITGTPIRGGALDILGITALALLLNLATSFYGAGVALRLQTTAAGVLVLIPTFMVLFMSPVFAPRHQLNGWLHTAANINPLTPPMEAARALLANKPEHVALGFIAAGGLVLFFGLFAIRGMRKAERGPSERQRRRPPRGPRARPR